MNNARNKTKTEKLHADVTLAPKLDHQAPFVRTGARVIAPGSYKARAIAGSEQWRAADNGDEVLSIDIEILDDEGKTLGRRRTRLKFDEWSAPYSIKRLRALGWRGTEVSDLAGLGERVAGVDIEKVAYQGRTFLGVSVQIERDAPPAQPLAADRKAALAARLRDVAAATPALASVEADTPDDELPF